MSGLLQRSVSLSGSLSFEVGAVHSVVLALRVRPADELAAEPRARRLGRRVLRLLHLLVAHQSVHPVVPRQEVVDTLEGPDVARAPPTCNDRRSQRSGRPSPSLWALSV